MLACSREIESREKVPKTGQIIKSTQGTENMNSENKRNSLTQETGLINGKHRVSITFHEKDGGLRQEDCNFKVNLRNLASKYWDWQACDTMSSTSYIFQFERSELQRYRAKMKSKPSDSNKMTSDS